jgi:hypothetical protein
VTGGPTREPRPRKPRQSEQTWDDEYFSLLAAQHNRCAIPSCTAQPKTRRFSIDHDHVTGRIRGLLCHRHNRRLWRGATAVELREMADYLESAVP